LTGYYLPGYKAGGPIRSISGMIESLGDDFEFRVLTTDRDLGDTEPYPGIARGTWIPQGKAQVMYLSPQFLRLGPLARIIRETPYDMVYLGGCFDPTLVLPALLLRRLGLVKMPALMLAPQGVFSPGALGIKALKKKAFLALARTTRLYGGLTWHVSTIFEKHDVHRVLRLQCRSHFVVVAPDIHSISDDPPPLPRRKSSTRLQVVFLSRVCPKKNLDGAIRILQGIEVPVDFHIYGPAEDQAYWHLCEDAMRELPPNVSATYRGPIAHSEVAAVMRSHDLFFLPTHGENFGHVIIEALREGCPALIGDTTAFRHLEARGAGWDLPPEDVEGFRRILQKCAAMTHEQWLPWSQGARRLAVAISAEKETADRYRTAFQEIVARQRVARAA